jgi:tetratricopeptide (TPR) repeat protein
MLSFHKTTILRWRPSRHARLLFLFAACSVALATALQAARIAVINTVGESGRTSAIQKALTLDPANPELHHTLGLVQYYSSSEPDVANGMWHLRRATELNPNEALYWLDLALACEAIQNAACAGRSFDRAIELNPQTPQVYWAAGNYALRARHTERVLPLFRRLLDLDPTYAEAVFRVCNQTLGSAEWTSPSAPSLSPRLRLALVRFLDDDGQADRADAVWRQLAADRPSGGKSKGVPFAFSEVVPYLNRLIDTGKQQEAVAAWSGLIKLGVITAPDRQKAAVGRSDDALKGQYIFNGDFEQTPLNAGFDWRHRSAPFVGVTFPSASARRGSRSARIEFTEGRNEEYEPVFQWVPVQPGQSYVLSVFVRTDGITSDTGPRLRVQDPRCPACLAAATEQTVGTTPWHQIAVDFITSPQTTLVKVSVWRPRGRTFPFEITGAFWLDDVSLTATSRGSVPGTLAQAPAPVASVN